MSDPTRRELLTWGLAAAGAAAIGAGLTGTLGEGRAVAAAPAPPAAPILPPSAWRETGGWPVGLRQARALVLAGDALVAGGDGTVAWFAPDGGERRRVPVAGAVLALAVDAAGAVWLARSGAVERLAADGTVAWRCPLPVDCLPGGLAIAGGQAWVADCVGRRVLRFAADGSPAGRVGDGPFHIPSPWFPLAAGGDGLVWVSNTGHHRLEAYAADGRLVRRWGEAGMDIARFCGCCNPAAFQVLPDGRFVTAEKGSPRIKIHAADGAFAELVAGPDAFHRDTVGLVAAPDGRGGLAVLDPHARRIRRFARTA